MRRALTEDDGVLGPAVGVERVPSAGQVGAGSSPGAPVGAGDLLTPAAAASAGRSTLIERAVLLAAGLIGAAAGLELQRRCRR